MDRRNAELVVPLPPDRHHQAALSAVVQGWSGSSAIGWWIVDDDWSELRAWGGAAKRWFPLGPMAGMADLLGCFPIAVRDQLVDLLGRPEGACRCPITGPDGQLRLLSLAATAAGPGQLAYVGIEVTTASIDDLDRELAERRAEQRQEMTGLRSELADERKRCIELELENARLRDDLEAAHHAQRRLDESLAGLGDALSHTIHDVRAPLNTIVGFAELLERVETDPERVRWLEHVRAAADHILDTANRMLQLARAESGRAPVALEPLPLLAMVEDAASVVSHEAGRREIELDVVIVSDLEVLADRHMLSHVITNLLANAVGHAPLYGTVRVEAELSRSLVTLRVTDSGTGVPSHLVNTIFEPYRRDDRGAGRTGTGLGLAICREYVEAMGGSIGVENVTGAGASFWVDLPRSDRYESPSSTSVLVASNDFATLELLEHGLEGSWSIRPVRSLHALIKEASRTACAGVVIDVGLAPPSELDPLVDDLRAELAGSAPIIALSTGATDTPRGADASIRLPLGPSQLHRVLEELGVKTT